MLQKTNSSGKRMLELDALRGLSAISVLLFHYTSFYGIVFPTTATPPFYFPWIPYRLQLFSLISGFVILLVLEKTEKPMDFVFARFSRLYPAYFAAIVLIASILAIFPLTTDFPLPGRGHIPPEMIAVNFTMLQSWLGVADVDGVFWFLAPEISFYLIVLFLFMFKQVKHIEWLGVIGLVLVVMNARYAAIGPWPVPNWLMESRILSFWQYFYAGILFYTLKTKGDTPWRHAAIALCFITHNLISDNIVSIACFAACLVIFYFFIYGGLSWIAMPPLLFLGTISYSLYLVHQNIGYVVIGYLDKWGVPAWPRFIIPTAIAIGIATAMTFWIEKPAMKFLRAKYKSWRKN